MKKLAQKIMSAFTVFLMGFGLITPALSYAPVYAMPTEPATTFGAEAAILKKCANSENGDGGGIICVVKLVVNILSVLVGIAGVIGITVVGIQYLTAGGNEEQTRKAKRRLFEIILGVAAYAVGYALLYWLLPGFSTTEL